MDRAVAERWFSLSLAEQLVNIGNEVKRAVRFDSDREHKHVFLDRAIRYVDLTMQDPKNKKVLPELAIGREALADYDGEHILNCTKEQLRDYYLSFVDYLPDIKNVQDKTV